MLTEKDLSVYRSETLSYLYAATLWYIKGKINFMQSLSRRLDVLYHMWLLLKISFCTTNILFINLEKKNHTEHSGSGQLSWNFCTSAICCNGHKLCKSDTFDNPTSQLIGVHSVSLKGDIMANHAHEKF